MSFADPTVLALDFDGVICDGLREYFQTAWRAYCQIWQPASPVPPKGLAEIFYRLRPVVESGWEMPLVLHAVLQGMAEVDILQDWAAIRASATDRSIAPRLVQDATLQPTQLGATVDGIRDRWIAADLESWLAEHRFYPGMIDRLAGFFHHPTHLVIISTKEGRFIRQLLEQQGLDLSHLEIFGKEAKRPKHQILRELRSAYGETAPFWFIEDRLKTLDSIKSQPDLQRVQLFLADWGYNTSAERAAAEADDRIHLLSLSQWQQEFSAWMDNGSPEDRV